MNILLAAGYLQSELSFLISISGDTIRSLMREHSGIDITYNTCTLKESFKMDSRLPHL